MRSRLVRGCAILGVVLAMPAAAKDIEILSVGDLMLNVENPGRFFDHSRKRLREADVLIGHVEMPHTERGQWSTFDKLAAAPAKPANLDAMRDAGFDIATLSGNHIFDQGQNGVEDTLAKLRSLGIVTAGGGMNIDEARRPAIVERDGKRIAVLQYNLVGLDSSWATPMKAGGAFLRVITHYVNDISNPGGSPTAVYTFLDDWSVRALREDVSAVRAAADIVVVSFHMGRSGSDLITGYMRQASQIAIDHGADLVTGLHTHSISGVEAYKGKYIFYGLGNFVTVSENFRETAPHAKLRNWDAFRESTQLPAWPSNEPIWGEKKMSAHGGVKSPHYGFTDDTRDCIVPRMTVSKTNAVKVDVLACYIGADSAPAFVRKGERAEDIGERINRINQRNGISLRVSWDKSGDTLQLVEPAGAR